MNALELLGQELAQADAMLQQALADFADADMLVRPCAGANHAAWQLGHLVQSEHHLMALAGAPMPQLAPAIQAWGKDQQKVEDAAKLPAKAQLLAERGKVRAATVAFLKTLGAEQLSDTRNGQLPAFAPTVGALFHGVAMHDTMHLGQVQVIRRKLGKPVLF